MRFVSSLTLRHIGTAFALCAAVYGVDTVLDFTANDPAASRAALAEMGHHDVVVSSRPSLFGCDITERGNSFSYQNDPNPQRPRVICRTPFGDHYVYLE